MNSQCSLLSPLVILLRPFCPVLTTFMLPVPVSAVFQMSEGGGGFIWVQQIPGWVLDFKYGSESFCHSSE